MLYSIDFLNHVQAIKRCADVLGFSANINALNLALDIGKDCLKVRFQPRFIYFDAEKMTRNYSYYLRPDIFGFIGWLPYFNKVWPIALDKLAFKAHCREHGLPTPEWWTAPSTGVSDFLIKRKGGSFGAGMRGPYRGVDGSNPYHQLAAGEYYERFVEGRIAKIWYWDADPVCLELRDFPRIAGDGRRTIRELLEERLGDWAATARWPQIEASIAYQHKRLDSVLAPKETLFASFRYGSIFDTPGPENRNVLGEHARDGIADQLRAFGKALYESIPDEFTPGVLFTADAVLDSEGRFWLLEMNPNPAVHPDAYSAMLDSVLTGGVSSMPSLGSAIAGAPHLKGSLVWAAHNPSSRNARASRERRTR